MEATTSEVWFGGRVRIIWELDVDNIVIVTLWSLDIWKTFALIRIENTFRVRMGDLVVSGL